MIRCLVWTAAALVLLGVVAACDSDDECIEAPVVVDGPIVLHNGPSDPASLDAIWGRPNDGSVYVQFGDPQGFEDLSTAVLSIEDIRVLDAIGRDYRVAEDMGGDCNGTGAEYDEELPFDVLAMLPTKLGRPLRSAADS